MKEQMPTTREELTDFVRDYLKENLFISIDREVQFGGDITITVKINLNGNLISEDWFYLYND